MKKKRLDDFPYRESISKIIRVMKLVSFLLLSGFLQVIAADVHSQNASIRLSLQDVALTEVIKAVQMQTEFTFFYSPDDIKDIFISKVELENASLEKTLDLCLKGTSIDYEIVHKAVILKKGKGSILESPDVPAQQQPQKKEISGTVKDSKGLPLPGVSVVVKGTTTGIVTDADGKFTLSVPAEAKKLTFSFVGMKAQEIDITGKATINLVMQEEVLGLDEVVAVGYGVQKKVNLTGAVETVRVEEFGSRPLTNASAALQGKVAGAYIQQNSGQPGKDDATILIRGLGTFNDNTPLVIIDGMQAALNDVNPKDIEAISVLKDAASTAIYGNRAANGVLLITTKRGQIDKMQIDYTGYYGVQSVTSMPKLLKGVEYLDLMALAGVQHQWYLASLV